MMPNDGVGLARMEFIISEHIGVHPMALVHPERSPARDARARSTRLTRNYATPPILRRAVGRGGRHDRGGVLPEAGDHPSVRLQDQRICQPARRGAGSSRRRRTRCSASVVPSRYAHPAYAAGFALECAALRRVRDEMGLTNLRDHGAVLPPGRRRREQVIEAMARARAAARRNGLEIYVMCEIPNNVIRIEHSPRCSTASRSAPTT